LKFESPDCIQSLAAGVAPPLHRSKDGWPGAIFDRETRQMEPDKLISDARVRIIGGEPSSAFFQFLVANGFSDMAAAAITDEFTLEREMMSNRGETIEKQEKQSGDLLAAAAEPPGNTPSPAPAPPPDVAPKEPRAVSVMPALAQEVSQPPAPAATESVRSWKIGAGYILIGVLLVGGSGFMFWYLAGNPFPQIDGLSTLDAVEGVAASLPLGLYGTWLLLKGITGVVHPRSGNGTKPATDNQV
jgi:hypothetical protein